MYGIYSMTNYIDGVFGKVYQGHPFEVSPREKNTLWVEGRGQVSALIDQSIPHVPCPQEVPWCTAPPYEEPAQDMDEECGVFPGGRAASGSKPSIELRTTASQRPHS